MWITLFIIFMVYHATAQGNLMLMQKRVVFEGNKRIATVQYANNSGDSAHYSVSLVHIRMNGDGTMERIDTPLTGEMFADDYVRYFPRNIVLGPYESQIMKIQLINDRNLKPGEYRSHLYFRARSNADYPSEKYDNAEDGVSVSLKAVFGITIPLIIRAGENNSSVRINDLSFNVTESKPVLQFSLVRSGDFSVYGDITVTHISPSGKRTDVGLMRGVAVYTPGTIRRNLINLQVPAELDITRGSLVVRYNKQKEEKGTLLSEAILSME